MLSRSFSRAAADELRARLARALGTLVKGLWTGTFHGFGAWLLRQHAARLDRSVAFTILDREDTRRMIARLVQELGFKGDPATLVESVERAKAREASASGAPPCPPLRSPRSWPPTRRGAERSTPSTSRTS
jgi:superfamily I DNA/RNA helicase